MSDVMLFGVLRMPYEMAMADELSRRQFYDRAQEAVKRLSTAYDEGCAVHGLAHPCEACAVESSYEQVMADHNRLVRELDVLLNGPEGSAKQASLCDIVSQVRREEIVIRRPFGAEPQDYFRHPKDHP